MLSLLPAGTYLDRDVFVGAVRPGEAAGLPGDLGRAVVLFISSLATTRADLEASLHDLVTVAPMAIVLAGGAVPAFDYLLELLSVSEGPHVMTGMVDGDLAEAVELMLMATWPSDDRFDEWQRYVVVICGDEPTSNEVVAAVERVVRTPA